MAHPQEDYISEELREKMKKWGILKDDPSGIIVSNLFTFPLKFLYRSARLESHDVMTEIRALKKRGSELEKRVGKRRVPTKVDYVYSLFRDELEKEHFGKIVAIDTESMKIVGIGDTISEAYNKAKKKTGKDQFDFRRVGFRYLFRV